MRPVLRRVLHVNLSVHDVDACVAFYSEVLGLEPAPRSAEGGRPGAWFRLGGMEVHLSLDDVVEGATSRRHVAFEVDDLEAMRRYLVDRGVVIEGGTAMPGARRLFVRDPSGNRIEIVEGAGDLDVRRR